MHKSCRRRRLLLRRRLPRRQPPLLRFVGAPEQPHRSQLVWWPHGCRSSSRASPLSSSPSPYVFSSRSSRSSRQLRAPALVSVRLVMLTSANPRHCRQCLCSPPRRFASRRRQTSQRRRQQFRFTNFRPRTHTLPWPPPIRRLCRRRRIRRRSRLLPPRQRSHSLASSRIACPSFRQPALPSIRRRRQKCCS